MNEEKIIKIKNTIKILKLYLEKSDYKILKYVEGELTANEYSEIQTKRKHWRTTINELELRLKELTNGN